MRLVQVSIPTGKRESVTRTLDDQGIDFVLSEEAGRDDYTAIVSFPLPDNAVEPVLDSLRGAGLDEDAFTVVVSATTVVSRRFEQLSEEYAETTDADRIAREELAASADDLMPSNRNYLILTVVSAIVATAGILLDSPAVVVGSMVIAPLVGPALAASVGTVLDDASIRSRGVLLQAVGIGAAIASAAVFAALVQFLNLVPPGIEILEIDQVRERFAPDFLALAIALGAGVAGALSLSTGVSAALVGVMIAVALIPPAAVVGIGIAWAEPNLAFGSFVLVLVNILSINLAALAVLWYQGYRPESWFRFTEVRSVTLTRIGVIGVVIVLLSVFLGGVTFAAYQGAVAEQAIDDEAQAVVDDHEVLVLLDVQVESENDPLRGVPDRAVVTIGKPERFDSPRIAGDLEERIEEEVGSSVTVEVRFVEVQTTNG